MRKEDGIISPCLVCFHESSNQKEKMSHSASFPIWWFGLWATVTKRGQHSVGFEFTESKTLPFLLEHSTLSKALHSVLHGIQRRLRHRSKHAGTRKEGSPGVAVRTQLCLESGKR